MPHCGYADLTRFEDSVDINWRTGGPGGPVGDDEDSVDINWRTGGPGGPVGDDFFASRFTFYMRVSLTPS